MKTTIMLLMLTLSASVANAEIYKWEDANGVHFTDNASSVPEKYREMHLPDTNANPQDTPVGKIQQNRSAVMQPVLPPAIQPAMLRYQQNQAANYQANLEQQRRAAEVMRQQQAKALAVNTRNFDKAINSLANFLALWLLLGFVLFVAWVSTIVDIVRSDFISPSNKSVWMLLVLFLPIMGMVLYNIFGPDQKCKTANFSNNNCGDSNFLNNERGSKGNGPDPY